MKLVRMEISDLAQHFLNIFFQTIPESAFCTTVPPTFLFEASFFLFFLIPMIIMVVLYIRMGLKIRSTTRFGENSNVHGESRQAQSRKAILRMLGKKCYYFNIMCQVSFQNWQIDPQCILNYLAVAQKNLLNYSTS